MSIHLYLSPHMDDAVLSCGGQMAAQIERGERVRVLNIFAGIPDYTRLSAYAERQHNKWGRPADPVSTRRIEDERVLDDLGAEVEYWEFYDCIYRQANGEFLYTHHDAVFGPIHPAETALIATLTHNLRRLTETWPEAVFYAPIGAGGHVDHRLVRASAVALQRTGLPVQFYEDFPYVAREGVLGEAQAELPVTWTSHLTPIDVARKIATIAGYASQLLAVFHDPDAMPDVVRGYASSLATDEGYYERYWGIV
jgi:LmbE family N-acetylglucosaminyl deacetylase